MKYKLIVVCEGVDTYECTADQRDAARWEMLFGVSTFDAIKTRPIAFQRWLAYSAGKRAKAHELTWDAFEEKCISVEPPSTVDGDDDTTDPGPTAA